LRPIPKAGAITASRRDHPAMNRYEITVIGRLEARRARALGAAGFRSLCAGRTVLLFESIDQAATYGLLARLRDAGLELVSLELVSGAASDLPSRPMTRTGRDGMDGYRQGQDDEGSIHVRPEGRAKR
jgi:hypothetical protein